MINKGFLSLHCLPFSKVSLSRQSKESRRSCELKQTWYRPRPVTVLEHGLMSSEFFFSKIIWDRPFSALSELSVLDRNLISIFNYWLNEKAV